MFGNARKLLVAVMGVMFVAVVDAEYASDMPLSSPECRDHAACAGLGLNGPCCPTVEGVQLECCGASGVEPTLSTSSTPMASPGVTTTRLAAGDTAAQPHPVLTRKLSLINLASAFWEYLRRQYFEFWETQVEQQCIKHAISDSCCAEIVGVAYGVRFKFYVSVVVALLLGIFLPWYGFRRGHESFPPRYWAQYSWSKCCKALLGYFDEEVDVTPQLRDTMQRILGMAFEELDSSARSCEAAKWMKHTRLKVTRVTRIENRRLWTKYKQHCDSMRRVGSTMKHIPEGAKSTAEAAVRATRELWLGRRNKAELVGAFVDSLHLDESRNETLLFHGCLSDGAVDPTSGELHHRDGTVSPLQTMKKHGFDDRLGDIRAIFGSGLYFTDSARTADMHAGRYTPPAASSVGETASIFLSRVCLGCPYVSDKSLQLLRRPPCVKGHFDINLSWSTVDRGQPWSRKGCAFEVCDHPRYDSVISAAVVDGEPKPLRDYVVYGRQCYPEFCITYIRDA